MTELFLGQEAVSAGIAYHVRVAIRVLLLALMIPPYVLRFGPKNYKYNNRSAYRMVQVGWLQNFEAGQFDVIQHVQGR